MENLNNKPRPQLKFASILKARCPSCHKGSLIEGFFTIRPKCLECGYNFHPEPGFYLGAMVVGFLLTAILTIPPMIILKVLNVEIEVLVAFPFIEFIFLGTFLMLYCRIIWLHFEYQMTRRMNSDNDRN